MRPFPCGVRWRRTLPPAVLDFAFLGYARLESFVIGMDPCTARVFCQDVVRFLESDTTQRRVCKHC